MEAVIPESWNLITTADGEHRFLLIMNGERKWFSLNALDRDSRTDAEILEMGKIRRCVPVTLPDDWDRYFSLEMGNIVVRIESATPRSLKDLAAALLAYATYTEEGGDDARNEFDHG